MGRWSYTNNSFNMDLKINYEFLKNKVPKKTIKPFCLDEKYCYTVC